MCRYYFHVTFITFRPCSIDAALFASLTILLKAPLLSCKLQNHLKTKVNLCQYVERILADCFKKPKVPGNLYFFYSLFFQKRKRGQSVENFKNCNFLQNVYGKIFCFLSFSAAGNYSDFQNMLQRSIGMLNPAALYFINSTVKNE